MMLTRNEVGNMRDSMLEITADRCRGRLRVAWNRGQAGSLSDVYDLALLYAESNVRGVPLPQPQLPGQMSLDEPYAAFGAA